MGGTSLLRNSPLFWRVLTAILGVVQPVLVYFNPHGTYRTPFKSGTDLLKAGFERGEPYGEFPKAVYLDGSVRKESSFESRDREKQRLLWRGSIEIVKLKEGETGLVDWK
jgi:hypothetical protein